MPDTTPAPTPPAYDIKALLVAIGAPIKEFTAAEAVDWVQANETKIVAVAQEWEIKVGDLFTQAINSHMYVTPMFGLKGDMQNTVAGAIAQLVEDAEGENGLLLHAIEALLIQQTGFDAAATTHRT